jgi:hypothetical protein
LAHFLRHEKGNPQVAHIFCGRSAFFRIFAMGFSNFGDLIEKGGI